MIKDAITFSVFILYHKPGNKCKDVEILQKTRLSFVISCQSMFTTYASNQTVLETLRHRIGLGSVCIYVSL